MKNLKPILNNGLQNNSIKNIFKKQAKLISYLKNEWNLRVADKYTVALIEKLDTLSLQPNIGKISSKNQRVRSLLISKHNRVFYKVKNKILSSLICSIQVSIPIKILTK